MKSKAMDSNPIENIRKLYNNPMGADVEFSLSSKMFRGESKVAAHKIILAASSPVFQKMFYVDMMNSAVVSVTGVSFEAFLEFLQFFYTNQVVLTERNIAEVMKLIEKYDMPKCQLICEQFLKDTVSSELVLSYYELALLYNCSRGLIKECEEIIAADIATTFKMTSFGQCNYSVMRNIFQMESLNCSEFDVFTAAMFWGTVACERKKLVASSENIRRELGDCFALIRFPTMSPVEFTVCYNKYPNLLEESEFCDIIRYILTRRPLTCAKYFKTAPRDHFFISISFLGIDEKLITKNNDNDKRDGGNDVFSEIKPIQITEGANLTLVAYDIVLPVGVTTASYTQINETCVQDFSDLVELTNGPFNESFQTWRLYLKNPFLFELNTEYSLRIELHIEISKLVQMQNIHTKKLAGTHFNVNADNNNFIVKLHFDKECKNIGETVPQRLKTKDLKGLF